MGIDRQQLQRALLGHVLSPALRPTQEKPLRRSKAVHLLPFAALTMANEMSNRMMTTVQVPVTITEYQRSPRNRPRLTFVIDGKIHVRAQRIFGRVGDIRFDENSKLQGERKFGRFLRVFHKKATWLLAWFPTEQTFLPSSQALPERSTRSRVSCRRSVAKQHRSVKNLSFIERADFLHLASYAVVSV